MRISICIPQYNRSAYLLQGLESIREQTHGDVEVIVADDCSTDDTETVIPAFLERSGLKYKYFRHPKNLGYDRNLRSALHAATGDYLMVLGNDDALAYPTTLADLAQALEDNGRPALAFGNNYAGPERSGPSDRARETARLGSGPDLALRMFRAFSCVTGLVFERHAYLRAETDKYDGSIYVQMYVCSRMIAEGGELFAYAKPIAVTGLEVEGKRANSYLDSLSEMRNKIRPILGGLDQVGSVVCDAIQPFVPEAERQNVAYKVFRQILTYSYPYWLFDYRKRGEPWASFNLALGCFPASLARHVDLSPTTFAKLVAVYVPSTAVALFTPIALLDPIKEVVRGTSRRFA